MDIIDNIKELFSWVWNTAKTPEEKSIKKYDILIALCVVFMLGYGGIFMLNLNHKVEINTTNISNIESADPNYNPAIYSPPDSITTHPFYTTNALTDKEFYVGEIVGVKYFGVFGMVREKTLGTSGYVYSIRYEDASHDLMREDCSAWELYRPAPGSIPISILRQ